MNLSEGGQEPDVYEIATSSHEVEAAEGNGDSRDFVDAEERVNEQGILSVPDFYGVVVRGSYDIVAVPWEQHFFNSWIVGISSHTVVPVSAP